MGNSPSTGNDDFDKDDYIEQQEKLILEQNEQIQKLSKITQNNEKKKINPYHELNIGMNYDEEILKKAYLKRAMESHPDRGGSTEEFKLVTACYRALMIKLKNETNAIEHNELRENSMGFINEQSQNTQENKYTDLSKKFNSNVFNQVYEENRVEDVYDDGYEGWMKKEDSFQKPEDGSLTEENFNNQFLKYKQKNQIGKQKQVTKYKEPEVDISYKNKSSIMTLGQGRITDFSGESGGLMYRDYKDAFSNPYLVQEDDINMNKRPKDLKKIESERENISYEMDEKDQQIHALKMIQESKEEELRIQRLRNYEEKAFDIHEKLHQRLIG
tara:strand:- start:600 stop:1586 length:987 start_codon:yes stop_codon:yes gene_type:complete